MSSPKARALSSYSIPPTFITGAGVDNHAVEVRTIILDENVLHLFENTLVLGLHWFGHAPAEMA